MLLRVPPSLLRTEAPADGRSIGTRGHRVNSTFGWASAALHAARYGEGFPGHPAGVVGSQKHHSGGDISRLPEPAERGLLHCLALKSLPMIPAEWVPSVSTTPGLIEFTRTLRGPSSLAWTRVMPSTALLVAT